MWNVPSTLTMLNLQNSPLQTFQSQCLPLRHHALLSGIYRQALPIAPLSPAPHLRTPVQHPLHQPLRLKTLCHRLPPLQPISSQSLPPSPAISQAQSRARSRSRFKKLPCDRISPLFEKLQDGSHLSTHRQLQRMYRQ